MNRVKDRNPCLKFITASIMSLAMLMSVGSFNDDSPISSSNTMVVYAVDGIPDNNLYDNATPGNVDPDKPAKPNANDVFGDAVITPDYTGYADGIGNILQKVASFVVSLCNYVFIFGLIIHFVIESVMMAFPVVATLMATKVPVQLFSNECAKVCGVTYNYSSGGSGPGGGASGAGGKDGEKGFTGKFAVYFKERMITLILAGIILVMCATGIMPWLINTAINWIIGLFIK